MHTGGIHITIPIGARPKLIRQIEALRFAIVQLSQVPGTRVTGILVTYVVVKRRKPLISDAGGRRTSSQKNGK